MSRKEKELEQVAKQFDQFDENVKSLTLDRMNAAPVQEVEPQTKLSTQEIEDAKRIYLKPKRSISSREKFNEKFREDYIFQTEYVQFIAENREITGEKIDLWTKPFPGVPAQEWEVPVNVPVWGPRHLAEQIRKARYHRLIMKDSVITGADHAGSYYGAICVDTTVQRLDAYPVSTKKKSFFMGA